MKNILKVVLWVIVLGIVIYLAFSKTKREVVAPTPEMTGGAAGERAMAGENNDTSLETSADIYVQTKE
ncbi:MAG: hypothetical protein R3B55_02695 [Candidatus Paceibacterota bacterium]